MKLEQRAGVFVIYPVYGFVGFVFPLWLRSFTSQPIRFGDQTPHIGKHLLCLLSVDLIWTTPEIKHQSVSVTFIYGHLCGLTDPSIWLKVNYDLSGTARDRNNDADFRKDYLHWLGSPLAAEGGVC
jgi:hypothetical protein